ncbi:SPOR domain-containing protein [Haliea sp. E17]|uniref:tetratricopeptide repeat protein n=1 Tax=Haliea sp. E17 TaxID=3401576 RepID=UPI003AB04374
MRLTRFAILLSLACAAFVWARFDIEDGYDAFARGDVNGAVAIWRELAEAGDTTAQFNLGQLYRAGQGVPQDDREAYRWYLMAAQAGMVSAQHNLVLMYEEGRISRRDIAPLLGTSNLLLPQFDPNHYLVQVLTSSDRGALDAYIQRYLEALAEPLVIQLEVDGKRWYALMLGPFATGAEAQAALAALPAEVRALGGWVRKVGTVKALSVESAETAGPGR